MISADRQPVRALIHGSCVSRDTYSRLPAGRFTLVDYVARQSLITAAAPGPDALRYYFEDVLTSRFQRRVTRGSLLGDLGDRIRAVAESIDVLLWDITDERLGVYAMPEGGFTTRTVELIASGADSQVARHGRLIEFGTDEHFALWARATTRWLEALREMRLDERVLLLRAPWAEVSDSGADSPSSFGVRAADFNTAANRYYQFVAETAPGVTVVSPRAPVRSSPDNIWGDAPFHYDEPSYEALALAVTTGVDDPDSALAVPQPVVMETSARSVLVTTAMTWGAAFALHVTRGGDRIVRLPYQRHPTFTVDLPGAGRYGFRVFHRSADGGLVSTATAVARLSR
jgi:hypothetical protein